MKDKFEIGFEVGLKKWFIQYWTKNRWNRGQTIVNNSCIKLKDAIVDTYCWADSHNELLSHGRLRFYEGNDVTIKQNDSIADSIHVQGKKELKFIKYQSNKAELKYNIDNMSWTIILDNGIELETCDIKGVMDVNFSDEPIRAILSNVEILHSWMVTLVNLELESKK